MNDEKKPQLQSQLQSESGPLVCTFKDFNPNNIPTFEYVWQLNNPNYYNFIRTFCYPFDIDSNVPDHDAVIYCGSIYSNAHQQSHTLLRSCFTACSKKPNFKYIIWSGKDCVSFDYQMAKLIPSNVVRIYANNVNINDERVRPIPLGRDFRSYKEFMNNDYSNFYLNPIIPKTKWCYCNFSLDNQPTNRLPIYERIKNRTWMTYRHMGRFLKYELTRDEFFKELASHRFAVSPEGWGLECYRHWDSFYLKTIPIVQISKAIKHFSKLPFLFTHDYSEINPSYLHKQLEKISNTTYDFRLLTLSYWFNIIIEDSMRNLFITYIEKSPISLHPLQDNENPDTWCIIPYYNPNSYKQIEKNYVKCVENLKKQGAKVLTVELETINPQSQTKLHSKLSNKSYRNLADLHITKTNRSILDQTSLLLEIGISNLPLSTETVCLFAHSGIILSNNNWITGANHILNQGFNMIEPYDHCVSISLDVESKILDFGNQNFNIKPSFTGNSKCECFIYGNFYLSKKTNDFIKTRDKGRFSGALALVTKKSFWDDISLPTNTIFKDTFEKLTLSAILQSSNIDFISNRLSDPTISSTEVEDIRWCIDYNNQVDNSIHYMTGTCFQLPYADSHYTNLVDANKIKKSFSTSTPTSSPNTDSENEENDILILNQNGVYDINSKSIQKHISQLKKIQELIHHRNIDFKNTVKRFVQLKTKK